MRTRSGCAEWRAVSPQLTLKRTTGQPQCERRSRVFTGKNLDRRNRTSRASAFHGFRRGFPPGPHAAFSDPAGTPVELCAPCRRARACTPNHPSGAGAADGPLSGAGAGRAEYQGSHGPRRHFRLHLHRRRAWWEPSHQNNPWDIVLLTLGAALPSRQLHDQGARGHDPRLRRRRKSELCRSHRTWPRPPRASAFLLSLCARSGRTPHRLLPESVIDIDDEPVRCVVSPKANSNLWGLPAPRTWVDEATNFAGVEIRRPPVEGEPMTAEKYLAARIPEAVVS